MEVKEKFTFDEVKHAYFLDGKPMHGTTTVLGVIAKPALISWAANMVASTIKDRAEKIEDEYLVPEELLEEARTAHTKKKEKAGEAGTEVHAEIERIIKNAIEKCGGYICPDDVKTETPQVRQFISWAMGSGVRFLASELRLYSESLWVAGTADFVCEIGEKLYIGDIKTSSAIYPEHFIQASAYAHMAQEMGLHEGFHGVTIVNIPKKGGLNVQENYDLEGNFECFKACLTIYKQLKSIK